MLKNCVEAVLGKKAGRSDTIMDFVLKILKSLRLLPCEYERSCHGSVEVEVCCLIHVVPFGKFGFVFFFFGLARSY